LRYACYSGFGLDCSFFTVIFQLGDKMTAQEEADARHREDQRLADERARAAAQLAADAAARQAAADAAARRQQEANSH
jgi:hypothetical protein